MVLLPWYGTTQNTYPHPELITRLDSSSENRPFTRGWTKGMNEMYHIRDPLIVSFLNSKHIEVHVGVSMVHQGSNFQQCMTTNVNKMAYRSDCRLEGQTLIFSQLDV